MAFSWHGRNQSDGIVWEQEIVRYQFTVGETITVPQEFGPATILRAGQSIKISKGQAHKFFKKGFVELYARLWDSATYRYTPTKIPLTNGVVSKDIETRVLRELPVTPEEVAPPARKKK